MKIAIDPKPIIMPCPILIVGTYNQDGSPNIMNAAWGGVASSKPPCITVSLREATHSFGNIKRNGAFTVNIPSHKYTKEADYAGIVSGRDHNKFLDTGLTHQKSEKVNAPIVMEFPYALECKLIKYEELGLHTMFIGEVVGIIADQEVIGDKDLPDIEKVQPILFGSIGSKSYYKVGEKLGDAYSIGKLTPSGSTVELASSNFSMKALFTSYKYELLVVILLAFIAGVIANIPDFISIEASSFFSRNISFVVFPVLALYFLWRQSIQYMSIQNRGVLNENAQNKRAQNKKELIKRSLIILTVTLLSAIYINILPGDDSTDTFILAGIHLPLFMWVVLGFAFVGNDISDKKRRIDFLKFNGDFIVITTVLFIAGAILAVTAAGLFELINIDVADLYLPRIAVWGLAALPVVGTYLVQSNPLLVKNVSPIVAKVFTPLVLILLVIYLSAIIYTGKDPYNDREFLLIYNLMLVGVMAIIFFSVVEGSNIDGSNSIKGSKLNIESKSNISSKLNRGMLFSLSAVTVVVNLIALSAIVFRISEWGLSPNRLAVLGINLLILTNLTVVSYYLLRSLKVNKSFDKVQNIIALFLPIYGLWALLVTFLLPLLFGFK